MKPVDFPGSNTVFAANQPPYLPLPALLTRDSEGRVISCWELDDADIADILKTRRIYVHQLTFGNLLQPQAVTTGMPPETSKAIYEASLKDSPAGG